MRKEGIVDGLDHADDSIEGEGEICIPCLEGKQMEKKLGKGGQLKTKEVLELIHSDYCGPLATETASGTLGYVSFLDDFSGYGWIYLVSRKSDIEEKFIEFLNLVENKLGKHIKKLHTNGGSEYSGWQCLIDKGIEHQVTQRYTPQCNEKGERFNRTCFDKAKSMLRRGNLPDKYWGEAILTSNDLRNMLPASGSTRTPHEIVYGMKPDVGTIRTFRCMAYAKRPEELHRKLDSKTVKCRYLGRTKNANGLYRLLISETGRVITFQSVVFDENDYGIKRVTDRLTHEEQKNLPTPDDQGDKDSGSECEEEERPRRSLRSNLGKKPEHYGEAVAHSVATELVSYQDAIQCSNKKKWQEAIIDELDNMRKNRVFLRVQKQKDRNIGNISNSRLAFSKDFRV
jgi:hypothetical protein